MSIINQSNISDNQNILIHAHDLEYQRFIEAQASHDSARQQLDCGGEAWLACNSEADPPLSNRGVNSQVDNACATVSCFEEYPRVTTGPKKTPLFMHMRRGLSNTAFIDWITFSFPVSKILQFFNHQFDSNTQDYETQILILSEQMLKIFGFGISSKASKGLWFHEHRYLSGNEKALYANVLVGHKSNIITVDITGTGCMSASDGWEVRLYEFIEKVHGTITRCDVARDFFDHEYTPDKAFSDWKNGLFVHHGVTPKGQQLGSDWLNDDGTGKTFTVGVRGGAKYGRIYDKAKQLGDKETFWVRFEIEYRKRDGWYIPNDILLHAGHYWGGAYPICEDWQTECKRIKSKKALLERTVEKAIDVAKVQVGRVINFLCELGWTDTDIVKRLKPNHDLLPNALMPERFFSEVWGDAWLHDRPRMETVYDLGDIPF